jgi:hypothetical protein
MLDSSLRLSSSSKREISHRVAASFFGLDSGNFFQWKQCSYSFLFLKSQIISIIQALTELNCSGKTGFPVLSSGALRFPVAFQWRLASPELPKEGLADKIC